MIKWVKGKKKKGIFSKAIIIGMFGYIVYFVERTFQLMEDTQIEPVALIGFISTMAMFELNQLASIKKAKLERGNKDGRDD